MHVKVTEGVAIEGVCQNQLLNLFIFNIVLIVFKAIIKSCLLVIHGKQNCLLILGIHRMRDQEVRSSFIFCQDTCIGFY